MRLPLEVLAEAREGNRAPPALLRCPQRRSQFAHTVAASVREVCRAGCSPQVRFAPSSPGRMQRRLHHPAAQHLPRPGLVHR